MRRIRSFIVLSFSVGLSVAACDGPTVEDDVSVTAAPVEATTTEITVAPNRMAVCHAAYREASEAVEAARTASEACEIDADCTVVVAETRCTGELAVAVNAGDEGTFLDRIARLDARSCATVDADCAPASEDEPGVAAVACVAGRCELAGE